MVARTDGIALDPGEFQSFDVTRADLPLAGEPGTGRLQVRCKSSGVSFTASPLAFRKGNPSACLN